MNFNDRGSNQNELSLRAGNGTIGSRRDMFSRDIGFLVATRSTLCLLWKRTLFSLSLSVVADLRAIDPTLKEITWRVAPTTIAKQISSPQLPREYRDVALPRLSAAIASSLLCPYGTSIAFPSGPLPAVHLEPTIVLAFVNLWPERRASMAFRLCSNPKDFPVFEGNEIPVFLLNALHV